MSTTKARRLPMQSALNRVIAESGLVTDEGLQFHSALVRRAWARAKVLNYLRPLCRAELWDILEQRRAVRSVLLGMLEIAATDETLNGFCSGSPSVRDVCDSLDSVAYEINAIVQSKYNSIEAQYWTLTEAGVQFLAQCEEPR